MTHNVTNIFIKKENPPTFIIIIHHPILIIIAILFCIYIFSMDKNNIKPDCEHGIENV